MFLLKWFTIQGNLGHCFNPEWHSVPIRDVLHTLKLWKNCLGGRCCPRVSIFFCLLIGKMVSACVKNKKENLF